MIVPPGALDSGAVVTVATLSRREVERTLKRDPTREGLTFVGGVAIRAGGAAFRRPLLAEIPNSMGLGPQSQVLVAELLPGIRGSVALALVDIAEVEPGSLRTRGAKPFPGIQRGGWYVFLWPTKPFEFFAGQVVDSAGAPVDGALVFAAGATSLVAETDPGLFNVAAPAGGPLHLVAVTRGFAASGLLAPVPSTTPGIPADHVIALEQGAARYNEGVNFVVCPDADPEDAFQQLLEDAAKKAVSELVKLPKGATYPTKPREIELGPGAPAAAFSIDYGEYFKQIDEDTAPVTKTIEIPEGPILPPLRLSFGVKMRRVVPVFHPRAAIVDGAPGSIEDVDVSEPVFSRDFREATVTVSLRPQSRNGNSTIRACTRTVRVSLEVSYTIGKEHSDPVDRPECPAKEKALDIEFDPAEGETACILPVKLKVTGRDAGTAGLPPERRPRPEDLVLPPSDWGRPETRPRRPPKSPATATAPPDTPQPVGSCEGGLLISTRLCVPIGQTGVPTYCLTAAEYTRATGRPLPSSCAPHGTSGCMESIQGAITLVNPCCPGLTCRVSSACGAGSVVGGVCMP